MINGLKRSTPITSWIMKIYPITLNNSDLHIISRGMGIGTAKYNAEDI